MASRSEKDLTPEARDAWLKSEQEFRRLYPDSPAPFLTCTYRSPAEQTKLYAQGRTVGGKIVTNAKAGQSNHNKKPSPAMDIAFKDPLGQVHWDIPLFRMFATIAKKNGLAWGGDWVRFRDFPHFEVKE